MASVKHVDFIRRGYISEVSESLGGWGQLCSGQVCSFALRGTGREGEGNQGVAFE